MLTSLWSAIGRAGGRESPDYFKFTTSRQFNQGQWYLYARREPHKFLEIFAKREDAKSRQAGTITNQRMEDDKRKQFAILDRIESGLTVIVSETVQDLMSKFPREFLRECRKFDAEWKAFIAE